MAERNLALMQWAVLEALVNDKPTVGVEGIRDTLAPCDEYKPVFPDYAGVGDVWIRRHPQGPDGVRYGRCDTDGHYLCVECVHISEEALIVREILPPDPADLLPRSRSAFHLPEDAHEPTNHHDPGS